MSATMLRLRAGAVRVGALLVACVVLAAGAAFAMKPADVPNPRAARSSWVADVSNVLSDDAERSLDAISAELKRTNGAEIAVVTVPETGDQTPKAFATELFNRWGIGDRQQDNGVLVLIVTEAHRVEVETGYGAEGVLPDGKVGRILDTYVVPRYREGDWDGGTVAGARALAAALLPADSTGDSLRSQWQTEPPAPEMPIESFTTTTNSNERSFPLLPLAALVIFAVLLVPGLIVHWFRNTFRFCSQCHRRMRKLTRDQETAYLSTEENFEEALKSMDHVVWRCDDCQRTEIVHRVRWFSGYAKCPKCKRQTLQSVSHTIVAATYESSGTRDVTNTCKLARCGHHETHRETIPRLERSSSSSSSGSSFSSGGGGGSFGGGSSGGGGAGRSW